MTCVTVLPYRQSDGEVIPPETIDGILERIVKQFGGYTAWRSHGGWIDPTTEDVCQEPGIRVEFTTPSEKIREVLDFMCVVRDELQQDALYLSIRAFDAILV